MSTPPITRPRPAAPGPGLPSRGSDLARQIVVISSVAFMIVAALFGGGLFGGDDMADTQGGALASDATYLAPAGPAFSIWSLIYILIVGYAIWQALPGQRTRERQRRVGWWIALSAVLNGLWLVAAQFLTLGATVIAIVLLLAVLGWTFHLLVTDPGDSGLGVVLLDVQVGLHLGWVMLATVANITAWLTENAPAGAEDGAIGWGIGVLVIVGVIGAAVGWLGRGRLSPPLASAWGLVWIGVARATGEPRAMEIAVTAWIVAAVIVLVPVIMIVTGVRGRGAFGAVRTRR